MFYGASSRALEESSFETCTDSCELCEKCLDRWREAEQAGGFADAEHVFSLDLITIILILMSLFFEYMNGWINKKANEIDFTSRTDAFDESYVVAAHDHFHLLKNSKLKKKRPEEVEIEGPAGVLAAIDAGVPTEKYMVMLLRRLNAELMVLGFLAFTLYVLDKIGMCDAIPDWFGGENIRWGPQRPSELSEDIETAHFSIFIGMLLYFVCLLFTVRLATYRNDQFIQYENTLLRERLHLAIPSEQKPDRSGASLTSEQAVWPSDLVKKRSRNEEYFRKLRATFIRIEKLDDSFPFAVYSRCHRDALMENLIEVTPSVWLILLVIFIVDLLLARFSGITEHIRNVKLLMSVMVLLLNCVIIFVTRAYLNKLAALTEDSDVAFLKLDLQKIGIGAQFETQLVQTIQGFLLFTLVNVSVFFLSMNEIESDVVKYLGLIGNILVFILAMITVPCIFVQLNMVLRVPPFVDEEDLELIAKIARAANIPEKSNENEVTSLTDEKS